MESHGMEESGDANSSSIGSNLNDLKLLQLSRVTEAGSALEKSVDNKNVDNEWGSNLLNGFSKLYKGQQFVDIILVVDGRKFFCHKSILAISSPFFMAMFTNDMNESQQREITLKEIDSMTMQLVLEYIYTGDMGEVLSEETVQNLLSAANRFQIMLLRGGCAEFMRRHISTSNCIGVYFFAKAHECVDLAARAKEIINKQFTSLHQHHEFLTLPADKLIEMISDDNIEVPQEETVYEACVNWLAYDLVERKQYIGDVISCVRLANISSYYFCDRIDTNPMLKGCESLRETLDSVRYYHMLRNRHEETDLNLMPRKGMQHERCVMIIANSYKLEDSLKNSNSIEMLMPKTGEVAFLCKLPQNLYTPGCAITGDNQLYLAGGAKLRRSKSSGSITTDSVSNRLYKFIQSTLMWRTKAKMQIARAMFSLTIVDGYIFAIGGQDGTEMLNSVERYDAHKNTWTLVASLPKPLCFMTSLSYKGKLYVFGGEDTTDVTNSAYRYDPSEDIWQELPPMSTARVLARSVVHHDKIYIIGGNGEISKKWKRIFFPEFCVSSVEVFDPESQTWSLGPELPNALCGAGIVKYGGKILIVGGEDDTNLRTRLCWLKEEKGRQLWVEGQELTTMTSIFGCVVANVQQERFKQPAMM